MLIAGRLGILLLVASLHTACSRNASNKHDKKSSLKSAKGVVASSKNSTSAAMFASTQLKKRWMPAFAAFEGRDPTDPLSYDHQLSQDAVFGANQDAVSYDNAGYGAEGLAYKYPAASSAEAKPYTGEETLATLDQEMASYLKPGIGDFPSDIPSDYKGDEGLGLVSENHLKSIKLPPSAMFPAHLHPGFSLGRNKGKGISDLMLTPSSLATDKGTEPGKDLSASATAAATAAALHEADTLSADLASFENGGGSPDRHKHKPVTGARRQGDLFHMPSQASFEPIGLPQVNPPNLYGSFGGALSSGHNGINGMNFYGSTENAGNDFAAANSPSALDTDESANNKLALTSSFHKGSPTETVALGGKASVKGKDEKESKNLMQFKLVSSLRKALMKHIAEALGTNMSSNDTGSGDSDKSEINNEDEKAKAKNDPEDDNSEAQTADAIENVVKASDPGKVSGIDSDNGELLESNLMKVDKKKLVHLLATFIKKNKQQFEDDSDEDDDVGHSGDNAADQPGIAPGMRNKESKSDDDTNLSSYADDVKARQGRLQRLTAAQVRKEKKERKHASRTGHLAVDPYAQIGLVDPSNNDKLAMDAYSRHDLDTSKADSNVDKSRASDTEKEKPAQHSKQKLKEGKEEDSKGEMNDESEEVEDRKQLEKLKKAKGRKEREELKKLQELQAESHEGKNSDKYDDNIDENEQEERKKLKGNNSKEVIDDFEDDKTSNKAGGRKSTRLNKESLKKLKAMIDVASGGDINPEVVKMIAEKLQEEAFTYKTGKLGVADDEERESDHSDNPKEKGKEIQYKGEKGKSKHTASSDTEENSEENASITPTALDTDGSSIQTMIEHMEKRLQNGHAKKPGQPKSKRVHKVVSPDEAYAQIGAMDPNVRKKKTISKKHHRRHKDS